MARATPSSSGESCGSYTLCVAGSRGFMAGSLFSDDERAWAVKRALYTEFDEDLVEDIGRVVSGGARGGDAAGEAFADDMGLPLDVYEPDWDDTSGPNAVVRQRDDGSTYNARAGFERNSTLVDEADVVLAFWDGQSRGTQDTIGKARDRLPSERVAVVRYDQRDDLI